MVLHRANGSPDGGIVISQSTEVVRRVDERRGVLAVCGDPIVGRALVLLLHGLGYDARFVAVSSLGEPEALDDVGLLLLILTPELDAARHEARSGPPEDTSFVSRVVPHLPILELVGFDGARGAAEGGLERALSWPCSTEQLKQRIEATFLAGHAEGAAL